MENSDADTIVRARLLNQFRQVLGTSKESLPDEVVKPMFDRLLAAGRIVLLLDALDQMPVNSPALPALEYLLGHGTWQSCRIILAARPYALERHWNKLFADENWGWRFVQLDEFNKDQQRQFLGHGVGNGSRSAGSDPGSDQQEAKQILTVPRVLEMVPGQSCR